MMENIDEKPLDYLSNDGKIENVYFKIEIFTSCRTREIILPK